MNCVNMNLDPIPIESRNVRYDKYVLFFQYLVDLFSALVDDWNIIYAEKLQDM